MAGHKKPEVKQHTCGYGDESDLSPETKAFINVLKVTVKAAKENNISLLEFGVELHRLSKKPGAYMGAVLHFSDDCNDPDAVQAELNRIAKIAPDIALAYNLALAFSGLSR